jgi:predicted nucleic acid-binding protein
VILVDTSVWVDHLGAGDELLADLLGRGRVLMHPFVIGELAMGQLRRRDSVLANLGRIPTVVTARHAEVMRLVTDEALFGQGIGYIDAHLLAATRLTPDASLWTRDRRLASVAERLSIAARVTH